MKQALYALYECLSLGVHLLRGTFHLMRGIWKIRRLNYPLVSIFGSSRLQAPNEYLVQAQRAAQLLHERGISVLTGGGPGIMEAVSAGAPYRVIGIGIRGLEDQERTKYANSFIQMDYFWARKWLLLDYSGGFMVFPGGFGTMDELSELVNLMSIKKHALAPIVLIGSHFWRHYKVWLDEALEQGLIPIEIVTMITITDDVSFAVSLIDQQCTKTK